MPGSPAAQPGAIGELPGVEVECGGDSTAEDLARRGRPYRSERASFVVRFQDEVNPYRVMSFFVLPGAEIDLRAEVMGAGGRFEACATAGEMTRLGDGRWNWRAPRSPGLGQIFVRREGGSEAMRLNAFVMLPYSGEEVVDGYRIGSYRRLPLRNNPAYNMPRG
ncbi:MAG: hypothetical protein R3244_11485, partial [Thermoanaerobaculia bacterium]|nr:hypothetical protein [Thermoanaerobaculia bacterium]